MDDLYFSEKFLTEEVVSEVMSEFDWGVSYKIEDDLPDNITVRFPRCTVFFIEGFEGDVNLEFSSDDTGTEYNITLFDAIHYVLKPEAMKNSDFREPDLIDFFSPEVSLEKVKTEVTNICILLRTYFMPFIRGDFNWLKKYKKLRSEGSCNRLILNDRKIIN